ncbi:MAG: hypothetical protein HFH75_08635 [Lachnospiraceae bacterium]|jgi:hypothetical protein|nr:hypothetical protein [Lachnospiraceae bacterium]
MLSILLTVLKVIGIAVLIILGLILFLVLLVLFVPVRYSGKGSYDGSALSVGLRASWLLHMISVRGEYQSEQALHIYLRIFGIRIYDNLRTDKKKSRHKKVKSTKTKTKDTGEIQAASSEESVWEAPCLEPERKDDPCVENAAAEERAAGSAGSSDESVDNSGKKPGIVQKIKIFLINFVNFFKNITFTIHKVCDTIVRIKDNIKYYLGVLQLDSTKRAFANCQCQLTRVLRKISPRNYHVSLHLGFDDPAVMGEILAVWGMLYPLHQGNIDIQPEFDQTVMEGSFSFRGLVSVFVFARAACILFFDKDIKLLIRQLKRSEI